MGITIRSFFKNAIITLALPILLVSCSTGNKFASSFGKRKYTKGYFWNNPERVEGIASNPETSVQPVLKEEESTDIRLVVKADSIIKTPHPAGERYHSFFSATIEKQKVAPVQLLARTFIVQSPVDTIRINPNKEYKTVPKAMFVTGILSTITGLVLVASFQTLFVYSLIVIGLILFVIGSILMKPKPAYTYTYEHDKVDTNAQDRAVAQAHKSIILGLTLIVLAALAFLAGSFLFILSPEAILLYAFAPVLALMGLLIFIPGLISSGVKRQ